MKIKHLIIVAAIFAGTKSFAQVGIGTTSPVSTLDVRGSASFNNRSITASTTLTSTDHTVVFTGTSPVTITLPSASGCVGREVYIKNFSSNSSAITIATTSSQTIDGSSSWIIRGQYEVILFMSDGTNWIVKDQSLPSTAGSAWWMKGNSGTTAGTHYIGTNDAVDFVTKTNNTEAMRVSSAGNVGIGTTSPGSKLDVKGSLRLSGSTSGFVGFAPAAVAGGTTYTLPSADGSSGQQLTTNGSGTLTWAAAGNVSSVSNTSTTNTLSTTVNGVSGNGVNIINSNTLNSSTNTLTSTVNGVAATGVNIINTNALNSSTNTLTSTVNGVAATGVNIINSNATSLSGANLTTTVNGVAATVLDLSPAITSKAWSLTGNSGTTSGTNYIGTNDAQDVMIKANSTERFTINKTTGFIHLNQQNQSTIMGYQAAQSSIAASATANVGIGYQAMYFNTSGNRNTALGFVALSQNSTGQDNTAVGIVALNGALGNYNTGVGSSAGYWNTTGNRNIFIGHNSGVAHSSGSSNIFIGDSVNYNGASSGSNLMNIGNAIYGSGLYTSTPFIGIGKSSPGSALDVKGTLRLSGSTSGYVGFVPAAAAGATIYTLPSSDGTSGYVLSTNGSGTLSWVGGGWSTTGNSGTTAGTNFIGTTDNKDLVFKRNSTTAGQLGSTSTSFGVSSSAAGSNSIAFGVNAAAGQSNCIAIGYGASANTNSNCMAIGYNAQANNNNYVTAIGYNVQSTTGQYTLAVGALASASSDDAIALGKSATASGQNSLALGTGLTVSASNTARIGNSSTTSIGGYAGWTNLSDGRFKTNIKEDVKGLNFIMKLRPVTYNLNIRALNEKLKITGGNEESIKKREAEVQSGFIAQEVEKAASEVGYDFCGVDKPKNENDVYGLRYAEFVVPMVKAIQEQQKMIEEQNKVIAELKIQIQSLQKK